MWVGNTGHKSFNNEDENVKGKLQKCMNDRQQTPSNDNKLTWTLARWAKYEAALTCMQQNSIISDYNAIECNTHYTQNNIIYKIMKVCQIHMFHSSYSRVTLSNT